MKGKTKKPTHASAVATKHPTPTGGGKSTVGAKRKGGKRRY